MVGGKARSTQKTLHLSIGTLIKFVICTKIFFRDLSSILPDNKCKTIEIANIGDEFFNTWQPEKIAENSSELLNAIIKLKPSSSKGTYFKSIHISSTMSPGISVDKGSIQGI